MLPQKRRCKMADEIERLKKEIEQLEEIMEKDHFGGLFDKGREKKNYKRLKRLRKELKELEDKT